MRRKAPVVPVWLIVLVSVACAAFLFSSLVMAVITFQWHREHPRVIHPVAGTRVRDELAERRQRVS